ncbi:MAG: phosphatidylserine decarboxylase family protein [Deltaproteobacteria bacterium]
MKKTRSAVAQEGLPIAGCLALAAWITAYFNFDLMSLALAAAAFFTLYFFRDPERESPRTEGCILAPADGRVVEIETVNEGVFLNRQMRKVGIFLSITDCHINRFPIKGRVVNTQYIPGEFNLASLAKASSRNQRLLTLIEAEDGQSVVMAQVTGFVARRIVSYLVPGDVLEPGERFGMIKFGSRVDLYLPPGYEITAEVGDRVTGGETIIGWSRK